MCIGSDHPSQSIRMGLIRLVCLPLVSTKYVKINASCLENAAFKIKKDKTGTFEFRYPLHISFMAIRRVRCLAKHQFWVAIYLENHILASETCRLGDSEIAWVMYPPLVVAK